MGVRILLDTHDKQACLYDSVTGWAFGPLFDEHHHDDAHLAAECFLEFVGARDVRSFTRDEIAAEHARWNVTQSSGEDDDAPCRHCDPEVDATDVLPDEARR